MPVSEHPMQALSDFLPDHTFKPVADFIHHYKVHLTISRQRKSVLGDYKHSGIWGANHRISINGNLNKYEFLITFLHELAHLLTYEQYRNHVEPHGKEWKKYYSNLLTDFVKQNIFPSDIENALQKSIRNPSATANGETDLLLVLRKYDETKKEGYHNIINLPQGTIFQTENGKIFRKGALRRKRFECVEIKTGLHYIFSPLSEVRLIQPVE